MNTTIQDIICGDLGSTDDACFSRCGKFLAVTGAPDSTLKVFSTDSNSRMRIPSARNVGAVLLRNAGSDVELLYSVRRSGQIERYLLGARKKLTPLSMPVGYDIMSLVDNSTGSLVAAGDSHGNLHTWQFEGETATLQQRTRPLDSSIYSVALTRGGACYFATGCQRQWKMRTDGKIEPLHGQNLRWECFTVASHDSHGGVAMAGDGNRIWLVDLPFRLDPSDDQTAGDGYPMGDWEMDVPDFSSKWSLRKRIYVPSAGTDRCSFIDSDAGSLIARLYMTAPRELAVVGDHGIEIWGLSPLNLLYSRGHRNSPSRRIFGVVRQGSRIMVAREK